MCLVEDPVRILRIHLSIPGAEPRTLSVVSYQRLVWAICRRPRARSSRTIDADVGLLRAINPAGGRFRGRYRLRHRPGLRRRESRSAPSPDRPSDLHRPPRRPLRPGRAGAGKPAGRPARGRVGPLPCPAGQDQARSRRRPSTCAFLLGEAMDEDELTALAERYRVAGAIESALEEVRAFWTDLVTSRAGARPPRPPLT